MQGIPAMAFSMPFEGGRDCAREGLLPVMRELMLKSPGRGRIWNVNFPDCEPQNCRGILRDRRPAPIQLYRDRYEETRTEEGLILRGASVPVDSDAAADGTDVRAIMDGYISIGTLACAVMMG